MKTEPYKTFGRWLALAKKNEPNDFDAAALATTDSKGRPDVRMVLVRQWDERGFVFFSHQTSAKGKQIDKNPYAALNFHWKSLRRQVRIRGKVQLISPKDADLYFSLRPRDHQLNAIASRQSQTLKAREQLMKLFADAKQKFLRQELSRPEYWVGYRIVPLEVEFWNSHRSRLHDRTLYSRSSTAASAWKTRKLFP